MRVTNQLIRQQATGPLLSLEYLDLSNSGIDYIERLGTCRRLQYLNLQGNNLQDVANLECCSHLWSINLSCNQIQCLDGLSRFLCFGTLILSNNNLSWKELIKIRHIHILNLSLHGNPQLERDQYYRIHVIDCLPNIWILDGRIVTSAERIQVDRFFQDSALSDHPVRRKLTRDWFITSAMKNIEMTGLFGTKATCLLTKFPNSATHNIEMDKRRLLYLASNLQDDLLIEQRATKSTYHLLKHKKKFLEELLNERNQEREKCNMLLLLLVASLEFVLPTHLVHETLETAKLQKMGKVHTMDLFLLPREVRCKVVSILLSAVKIDKDNKENGGLYDKLYLCLFYTVSELTRISQSTTKYCKKTPKYQTLYWEYKCLLAAEIVQLLCIVPALFEYIEKDIGVINLMVTATGDRNISQTLSQILQLGHLQLKDESCIYEELTDIILNKIQNQMLSISNKYPRQAESDIIINRIKALPIKRVNSAINKSEYHTKGISSPVDLRNKIDSDTIFPQLGDLILLGPQTLGKVISLPQAFIALVAIDAVPVSNGAMVSKLKMSDDHYTYINMTFLEWEASYGLWKPKGTTGDSYEDNSEETRFTIQNLETFQQELEKRAEESDQTPRPNSPEGYQPGSYIASEPLIYTPRQLTSRQCDSSSNKVLKTPHPMSSVLKDKLHLKLDLSKRTKSASVPRMTTPLSTTRRSESCQNITSENNNSENVSQNLEPESGEECVKGLIRTVINDCIYKAVDLSLQQTSPTVSQTEQATPSSISKTDNFPDERNTSLSSVNQNDVPSVNIEINSLHEQSKSENLDRATFKDGSSRSPQPYSVIPLARDSASVTQIDVQIPKFEIEEAEAAGSHEAYIERKITSDRKYICKRRDSSMSSQISVKARPFSAVDAYKTFVQIPPASKKRPSSSYGTYFQEAGTDFRMFCSKTFISGKNKATNPPPQRPTSPVNKDDKNTHSKLHVTKANDWLGGGRDLHKEMRRSRPKSGHIPGWKDGLPEGLRRPKSAFAARSLRNSKTPILVTPSSIMYHSMIYGGVYSKYDLPELPSLSDYPSLYQQSPSPRQLGLLFSPRNDGLH